MNNIQQGFSLLNETIENDLFHPDYDYTVELAQEYYDVFTGAGVEAYLRDYRANEDDQMFQQMLKIYETTIPSTVNNLDKLFEKPFRSPRIYNAVEHSNNTARDEILDRMKTFWQGQNGQGVDAYLRERWKYLNFYDPNSFIAVEFSDFNPVREKTRPFAIEYKASEVRRFSYTVAGILDYLLCERKISYAEVTGNNTAWIDGSRFILYLENDAVVYTEIHPDPAKRPADLIIPPGAQIIDIFKKEENRVADFANTGTRKADRSFIAQVYNLKSGEVPAFRVGYSLDPKTDLRTCLSPIHYALAFFKKELKSGAELDLTMRAHVFPQKYMYGPKCGGDPEENIPPCKNGRTNNGETCPACKGSGLAFPVHTSAQDLIIVPFPKNAQEPIIDLTKAMHYFSPPLDLVKFQEEYCDRLTEKAKAAVFSRDNKPVGTRNNGTVTRTATEMDYTYDDYSDTYRPFTGRYSYAWLFVVRLITVYTDNNEGAVIYHAFPNDYKLKTLRELYAERAAAGESGLPQHILSAIEEDIALIVYADDPDTLTKIKIKEKFYPFTGKSEIEIAALLVSPDILPYYRILYIYFNVIWDAIDEEIGDAFYLMPYEKQKAEIESRVNKLLSQVEGQKAKAFSQAQKMLQPTGDEADEEENENGVSQNN